MLPDDLFQHNGTDIMSAALVLIDTMGGADEEVLPLFKIAGGGVVELLLAVIAEHQAGKHIALSRRCSAVPLLPVKAAKKYCLLFCNTRMYFFP